MRLAVGLLKGPGDNHRVFNIDFRARVENALLQTANAIHIIFLCTHEENLLSNFTISCAGRGCGSVAAIFIAIPVPNLQISYAGWKNNFLDGIRSDFVGLRMQKKPAPVCFL